MARSSVAEYLDNLPRQTGFRESFAYAGESVDRGYSILVFPDGYPGRVTSHFRSSVTECRL
jgi:long-chain acyl-CoA synthetase